MERQPKLGLFASTQKLPTSPEDPSTRRTPLLESLLCISIRRRVLVKVRLKDDIEERLFEPMVVYLSNKHRLCVSGVQIADPQTPLNNLQMHNFEIGKIKSVCVTEQTFVIDPVIDRFDGKYANGIICSTY
jgi:hypothetical protein